MSVLLGVLIVAVAPGAPAQGRYPGAAEVLRCTFSESSDRDFDGWPDRWTRRHGPGFPHYVKIFISPEPTPVGGRCLRIEMDGGAAAAFTPPVAVDPFCNYVLEAWVNAEALDQDLAYLSLTGLDQRRQPVESFASEKLGRSPGWRKVRLGPVAFRSELIRQAVIGVHVEPGTRDDLRAAARFGDLWLGRLPRISLSSGDGAGLLTDPRDVKVTCTVWGLAKSGATVHLELYDVSGTLLAEAELPLTTQMPGAESTHREAAPGADSRQTVGTAQWQPPLPGVGFYRVRATLGGEEGLGHYREFPLVVIRPEPGTPRGQFGWSMARRGRLPPSAVVEWALQAGVKWVKYPLGDGRQSDEKDVPPLAQLIQRLSAQGIEVVGVIDRPPDRLSAGEIESPNWSIAQWLSQDRKVWAPGLETLGRRLGGSIRWWQLGPDGDTGFAGNWRLAAELDQIAAGFQAAGRRVHLGVGCDWMDPVVCEATCQSAATQETPGTKPAALGFLAMSADPPLAPQELAAYLAANPQTGSTPRWVTLQALRKNQYSFEDRTIDLVRQMIAAKQGGAAAIFLADPLSTECGLLDEDGLPGGLFLPWRTTALVLGDAKPAGSLVLPQGSANQVFLRARDAAMVVWNSKPTRETLHVGEGVRQLDVWGRETPLVQAEGGQTIEVGPLPSFVVGIDRRVAQWQLGVSLAGDRIPGALGQRHSSELTWSNPLGEGVEGTVRLVAPEGWTISPQETAFRMAGGESMRRTLDITAPFRTPSGLHLLRADFEVRADRPLRLAVYRPIHVGPEDLRVEVETQLNGRGELEVQQRFLNETDRAVRFDGQLLAPGRRRLTAQVRCPPRGLDVYTYRLAGGKELEGKTLWLVFQETDGPRELNYRFLAEP